MLSPERLTVKAAEALQAAAAEARKRGNAEIHGVHLLGALLEQQEGIVVPILQKLEIPVAQVPRFLDELREHLRAEGTVLETIRDTGDLSDETAATLDAELERFKNSFHVEEEHGLVA